MLKKYNYVHKKTMFGGVPKWLRGLFAKQLASVRAAQVRALSPPPKEETYS